MSNWLARLVLAATLTTVATTTTYSNPRASDRFAVASHPAILQIQSAIEAHLLATNFSSASLPIALPPLIHHCIDSSADSTVWCGECLSCAVEQSSWAGSQVPLALGAAAVRIADEISDTPPSPHVSSIAYRCTISLCTDWLLLTCDN